jgi:hypothetical protein
MKYRRIFFFLVTSFFFSIGLDQAVSKTLKAEESEAELKDRLWVPSNWNDPTTEFVLGSTRMQIYFTDNDWLLFSDISLQALQATQPEYGANWLKQGYFEYHLRALSVKFGRFSTAVNFTPMPDKLTTVDKPRTLFSFMAMGIQMKTKISTSLELVSNLTFIPDTHFKDPNQFDDWVLGWRINKDFGVGNIALSFQGNENNRTYGLDSSLYNKKWYATFAGYVQNATQARAINYGGYALVALTPQPWLELHTQADYQNNDNVSSTIVTNGIRFAVDWCSEGCVTSITGDVRTLLNQDHETKTDLAVKLQLTVSI